MRTLVCIWAAIITALCSTNAYAYPDGAPWGAARPSASENCVSCHFDAEPIRDSLLLRIEGLPRDPEPGETYDLTLHFDDPDAVIAGFQLIAQAENDQAGTFVSAAANVEFIGAAIRSTAPTKNDGVVSWTLRWHVPTAFNPPIVFYVAASASNNDGSPLGDTIHLRSYLLPPAQQERNR